MTDSLLSWWWQRYRLGWQAHPALYVVTEVVVAPAVAIAAFMVVVGVLPFLAAFPIGLVGLADAVVTWVAMPPLPCPQRRTAPRRRTGQIPGGTRWRLKVPG